MAKVMLKVNKSETKTILKKYIEDGDPRNIVSEEDLNNLMTELIELKNKPAENKEN